MPFYLERDDGKKVKIVKNEIYGTELDNGFTVDFQEQPANAGEPVHVHCWIRHPDSEYVKLLWDTVFGGDETEIPDKASFAAFLTAVEFTKTTVEPQKYTFEFVINGKLSKVTTLNIESWLCEYADIIIPRAAMMSLLGEV